MELCLRPIETNGQPHILSVRFLLQHFADAMGKRDQIAPRARQR